VCYVSRDSEIKLTQRSGTESVMVIGSTISPLVVWGVQLENFVGRLRLCQVRHVEAFYAPIEGLFGTNLPARLERGPAWPLK